MAKLVSSVYGDALFETAKTRDKLDEIYEEIMELKKIFEGNEDLLKVLESPKITREEKLALVDGIFSGKTSSDVLGLLKIVIEKNRQSEFLKIFDYFILKYKEEKLIGIAYVKSAMELTKEQKQNILDKLLSTTRYLSFEMHYEVDQSLIGGLIIRIKDRILDSSVKSKIEDIERKLMGIKI